MKSIIRKRWFWIVARVFAVAVFLAFCMGVWPGYLIHTYETMGEVTSDVGQTRWLRAGDVARQYFIPQSSWLSKIRLAVCFNEDIVTDEYLILRIEDNKGRNILGKKIFFSEIEDSCYFEVPVKKKLNSRLEYVWELSLPEEATMEYAVLCADNTVENKLLFINAEDTESNAINQYEYYAHYDRAVVIGGFWTEALLVLLALLELTDWMERRTERQRLDGGERA